MPKFMYTIILGAIIFWLICLRVLNTVAPVSALSYLYFLMPLFAAVSLTLSVPLYFFFHYHAPTFTNLKSLYRRSLKWGVFFGFGIALVTTLKLFGLLTILNLLLFAILYYAIFMQLRSSK